MLACQGMGKQKYGVLLEFQTVRAYECNMLISKNYAQLIAADTGLWFIFPLLGLWVSYTLVATNSFDLVRQ